MPSQTEICNIAISLLGISKEIGNVITENSQEANACRRFYENTRDEILRGFPWPFATVYDSLSQIEEDPNDEWGFSYQEPSDCLFFRRIIGAGRNPNADDKIPYLKGYGASGTIIFCDQDDAQGVWTTRVEDTLRFPPDFVMALSYRLAAYILPRITKGDPFQMGKNMETLFRLSASIASANALNEQQPDPLPFSSFISDRNS